LCHWFILFLHQGPSIRKKNDLIFCLLLLCTTTKPKQIINKPVHCSVFVLVFPCCCFDFIRKIATTKSWKFTYDISMLMLGPCITVDDGVTLGVDTTVDEGFV
jgi:hypothetical protein